MTEPRIGLRETRASVSSRDSAKLAAAVALLAIFWDAAVGHGLLWENDPYWTYVVGAIVLGLLLLFAVQAAATAEAERAEEARRRAT